MKISSVFISICFSTCVSFAIIAPGIAATYRCEDPSGITVLTDSLAQLKNCTMLLAEPSVLSQHSHVTKNRTHAPSKESEADEPQYDDFQSSLEIGAQTPDAKQDASRVITVPIKTYGGALVVTVRLNRQREAQLILDTGATMTVLSTDVALDLGLIASTETQLTTVNTAGGPVQVNVTRIPSIQTGEALVHDVAVAIHDLPDGPTGIDGLLGMSFLHNFLVTLDTDQQQLHLKPRH